MKTYKIKFKTKSREEFFNGNSKKLHMYGYVALKTLVYQFPFAYAKVKDFKIRKVPFHELFHIVPYADTEKILYIVDYNEDVDIGKSFFEKFSVNVMNEFFLTNKIIFISKNPTSHALLKGSFYNE